ncbi:MAG: carbohydrate ABC transporter permease [Spirochaetales bacterium]|nr:carbohydrate ABC transporter permease [Spirochaetales bacterium]
MSQKLTPQVILLKKTGSIIFTVVLYIILCIFTVIFLFPFFFMLVVASRSYDTIFSLPPPLWFGDNASLNFTTIIGRYAFFFRSIFNSLFVAVMATGTQIFFNAIGGFAFAKYNFKGKEPLFAFLLITLMMPAFVNIIPIYKLMSWFGWINTFLPLIIPGMANSFGIFLMRQYVQDAIPLDILDAARIDGVGEFQIVLRIVFPLIRPAIAVLGTITFIGSWNTFLYALLMLPGREMWTIPVALSSMNADIGNTGGYGPLMLANALSVFPLLVIFVIFSKQIIKNLIAGSIKG